MKNIRSFSIMTHADHDKSALLDRVIQICGGLSDRGMEAQVLGSMGLERECGITTKAQSVTSDYKASDGETYQFSFIDISGHANFSYEVSRSLAACEGTLLMVDVGQDAEAQILTNCYTAMEIGFGIVPVLSKIDLSAIDSERVTEEIEDIVGIDAANAVRRSAKTGAGVQDVLECLVRDIPPSEGDPEGPLRALIIDSWFDNYLGVVPLIHIKNGTLRKGDRVKVMSTGQTYSADHLDIFTPEQVDRVEPKCGEIGWLVCAIKGIHSASVGGTLTLARNPAEKTLPDFKKVKLRVYTGLFPISSDDYGISRGALNKLSLNDVSLFRELESSSALGFGFRYSFLGLLYIEIIQEYLERECDLDLITTVPAIVYEVETTSREVTYVDSPSKLPAVNNIYELYEPIAECHMLLPQVYLGNVITLCAEKYGAQTNVVYHGNQVVLTYEIPMAGMVFSLFDCLKSTSRGYVSLDYSFKRFQASDIIRVGVLVNGKRADALALIVHRSNSQNHGRELAEKIKDLIPCQQFDIAIQTATGTYIIARPTVKQLRKNVLIKYYSGGINRRKKPLQKQREGKKRMKQIGNVELPQEVPLAILYVGKDNE